MLLAAHGERRAGSGNEGVAQLAARLGALDAAPAIGFGFLKGSPSIGDAVARLSSPDLVVYPLFLSDGYFTQTLLPDRLREAGAFGRGRALQLLPPLGCDPALVNLVLDRTRAVAGGAATSRPRRRSGARVEQQPRFAPRRRTDGSPSRHDSHLCRRWRGVSGRAALLRSGPTHADPLRRRRAIRRGRSAWRQGCAGTRGGARARGRCICWKFRRVRGPRGRYCRGDPKGALGGARSAPFHLSLTPLVFCAHREA